LKAKGGREKIRSKLAKTEIPSKTSGICAQGHTKELHGPAGKFEKGKGRLSKRANTGKLGVINSNQRGFISQWRGGAALQAHQWAADA